MITIPYKLQVLDYIYEVVEYNPYGQLVVVTNSHKALDYARRFLETINARANQAALLLCGAATECVTPEEFMNKNLYHSFGTSIKTDKTMSYYKDNSTAQLFGLWPSSIEDNKITFQFDKEILKYEMFI